MSRWRCYLCSADVGPTRLPVSFRKLDINDNVQIDFLAVVPLYREELNMKLRVGLDHLIRRLRVAGVTEVLDLGRVNVGV